MLRNRKYECRLKQAQVILHDEVDELNLQVVASSGVHIDELHISTDTKGLVKG